ncbi:unnamed protein product [Owenia fusiformis]|uniref:Uncharacterized protein n=1 Tax=Owenia fusiformis TaxID=6347 RepID=A0A8J1XVX0_OWEFU|nr:unnamed protein product [Owenia fusiformis]
MLISPAGFQGVNGTMGTYWPLGSLDGIKYGPYIAPVGSYPHDLRLLPLTLPGLPRGPTTERVEATPSPPHTQHLPATHEQEDAQKNKDLKFGIANILSDKIGTSKKEELVKHAFVPVSSKHTGALIAHSGSIQSHGTIPTDAGTTNVQTHLGHLDGPLQSQNPEVFGQNGTIRMSCCSSSQPAPPHVVSHLSYSIAHLPYSTSQTVCNLPDIDRLPGPYSILNTEQNGHPHSKRKRSWSRAVFSNLQRKGLERRFDIQKYVAKPDRRQLAAMLGLTDAQVKVWFQNRRMKWRREKDVEKQKELLDNVNNVNNTAMNNTAINKTAMNNTAINKTAIGNIDISDTVEEIDNTQVEMTVSNKN